MEIIQTILLLIVVALTLYLALKQRTPRLKNTSSRSVMLDSSALIDGRVIDVAKTGFLSGTLVVPSSVLREMQYLADNADSEKRARARHGLDVVKELQLLPNTTVEILDDGLPGDGGVDERLVLLSKTHKSDLLTLDFNLNKVAAAEGIQVLNINELAQTLRMSYLPGEKRHITLVNKGQDKTQAVGYLEDGTMVVVENAGSQIGQSVEVEFTRALQTAAGKMLFAKKLGTDQSRPQKSRKPVAKKPRPTARKKQSPEDSLVKLANS
ncbi:hypothetical protein A3F64_02060 [Candidatus Saccharibacteria bacterium RIFCSPHIGHO2_12_FULL_42_8]|nr:MAG: hypothetical protein A3F64_02060 [Candidatus Saccharibacteria bacterium RIFCSPHIGHO2_12_FULL_42_8]